MDLEILENPRPAVSATKKVSQKHLCCGSNSYKIVCWEVGEPLTFEHFGWFQMISDDSGQVIYPVQKKNKEKSATGNSFPDLGGAQQLRSGSNIILAGGGWGFLSRFVEINYWIGCFDPDTSGLSRDLFESYFFLDICWILKMFPATNKVGFTETGCTQTQESCYGQLLIIRGCPINLLL